VGNNN